MVKLRDVAYKAGVSTATVSRVLNNDTSVSIETRKKVEKVIHSLNYIPSRTAQRLRHQQKKSNIIGIVIPDIQNPFYIDVLQGIEDTAYDNEYAVLASNFSQSEKREKLYLDILKSESVDGLIAAPLDEHDETIIELVKRGLPIVCVDRGLNDIDVDAVVVDNFKGAYDATKLLIDLGHRHIGFISGLIRIPTSRQRLDGYKQALQDFGIDYDETLVKFSDSKRDSGQQLTKELLQMKNPPTALFTGNNLLTLGAFESIHQLNLNIPNDIAIVGFDDMYWANSLNPPLTAVSQPGYEIGRRAAEMLFQRIENNDRPTVHVVLKTKLVIRRSCGS